MSKNIHSITSISNYAGFWLRLVAHIIDIVILTILQGALFLSVFIIAWLLQMSKQGHYTLAFQALATILLIIWILVFGLSNVLYFAIFESSKLMASPGKYALGIIVTDSAGDQISFWRALARNSAKLLSYLLLYFGFIMAAFTKKKQALHDIMANCLVVKKL
jgi:uncharacterized RDD family membrane protein YckC